MSTSRQRLKIFTANANPKLAEEIAEIRLHWVLLR